MLFQSFKDHEFESNHTAPAEHETIKETSKSKAKQCNSFKKQANGKKCTCNASKSNTKQSNSIRLQWKAIQIHTEAVQSKARARKLMGSMQMQNQTKLIHMKTNEKE